jgi:hypothetical protein
LEIGDGSNTAKLMLSAEPRALGAPHQLEERLFLHSWNVQARQVAEALADGDAKKRCEIHRLGNEDRGQELGANHGKIKKRKTFSCGTPRIRAIM